MGYHLAQFLITPVMGSKKSDFIEMSLHHLVTLLLYGSSYLLNMQEIGSTIAFIHDIADVPTNVSKMLSETVIWKYATIPHVSNIFVWGYTRLTVFPWVIYTYVVLQTDHDNTIIKRNLATFLCVLVVLHTYWYWMIFQIIIHYITKGESKDL